MFFSQGANPSSGSFKKDFNILILFILILFYYSIFFFGIEETPTKHGTNFKIDL